jgi:3-oxoadipate enol-lactonase
MFVRAGDGVMLWCEATGDGTPVVLVPGRGDSTDIYPRRFWERLVAGGCRVIRFDPRDTGLSADGGSTYALRDMADDVVAVLDAVGVAAAHMVGLSMGGILLVDIATRLPGRVLSLTFLSAMSPDPDAGIGEDFFDMIGGDPVATITRAMGAPTDSDRVWVEQEVAASAARAPERPDAGQRHQDAAFRLGWPEHDALGEVRAPSLLIHGDADRTLPLRHAEAFAAGIANSSLVVMPGMGHLPRPVEWDDIADRVARHIAGHSTARM